MPPVPLPERARWYQPAAASSPARARPGRSRPRPAHQEAPPPSQRYTRARPTGTASCFAWPRPPAPAQASHRVPAVTPTARFKAAEPSFSTKRSSRRTRGAGGAAGRFPSFPRPPPDAHSPGLPTASGSTGSHRRGLEKARKGEGQSGIWPSLTETNWELLKEPVFPHSLAARVRA